MRGSKFDFYRANLQNKLGLFASKPTYILFYIDRLRKYTGLADFDAFMISYPKSGRTWLQKMLIEAVQLQSGATIDGGDVSKVHEIESSFPRMLSTHAGSSWEEVIKNDVEITHDDYDSYQHAKIIYLYRDPRDVLVSQYYHILHRTKYTGFKKEYLIDNPNVGLKKIINFMNRWARYAIAHKENVYALSYEDLKEDSADHLLALMNHIGYPVINEVVTEALKNCTLDRMRMQESGSTDNPWANTDTGSNHDVNVFHSRKGISGEYKEFFTSDQIAHINVIIDQHLNKSYYSNYIG